MVSSESKHKHTADIHTEHLFCFHLVVVRLWKNERMNGRTSDFIGLDETRVLCLLLSSILEKLKLTEMYYIRLIYKDQKRDWRNREDLEIEQRSYFVQFNWTDKSISELRSLLRHKVHYQLTKFDLKDELFNELMFSSLTTKNKPQQVQQQQHTEQH